MCFVDRTILKYCYRLIITWRSRRSQYYVTILWKINMIYKILLWKIFSGHFSIGPGGSRCINCWLWATVLILSHCKRLLCKCKLKLLIFGMMEWYFIFESRNTSFSQGQKHSAITQCVVCQLNFLAIYTVWFQVLVIFVSFPQKYVLKELQCDQGSWEMFFNENNWELTLSENS